ncbi:MAG: group 1 truncated hemoglobin [Immundisolibacteraceae bacterium]|nr:group 1 truncated hemoglobin [Immundisolibacteraceae bacterium]
MTDLSLYDRVGGHAGIESFANNLLPRLQADPQLGRFWLHRGDDGVAREKQLLIDFLCVSAGGPEDYPGRDMLTTHKGMNINCEDWSAFLIHAGQTMTELEIPQQERDELVAFVLTLKADVVDVKN